LFVQMLKVAGVPDPTCNQLNTGIPELG
jgi:hypothetical protein